MSPRTRFSLAFALIPLAVAVPSYFFGLYFTATPGDGYHRYSPLYIMIVSALINAPLFGIAAFVSWPVFRMENASLVGKGSTLRVALGCLLPFLVAGLFAQVLALMSIGLNHMGFHIGDSDVLLQLMLFTIIIWGSWPFIAVAGGAVGLVFGRPPPRNH